MLILNVWSICLSRSFCISWKNINISASILCVGRRSCDLDKLDLDFATCADSCGWCSRPLDGSASQSATPWLLSHNTQGQESTYCLANKSVKPPIGDATTTATEVVTATTTIVQNTSTIIVPSMVTITTTSYTPVETCYAACDRNNLISQVGSKAITNGYPGQQDGPSYPTSDPYQCCVLSQTYSPGSTGYILAGAVGQCILFTNAQATCDPSFVSGYFITGTDTTFVPVYNGNGPCGQQQYDPYGG